MPHPAGGVFEHLRYFPMLVRRAKRPASGSSLYYLFFSGGWRDGVVCDGTLQAANGKAVAKPKAAKSTATKRRIIDTSVIDVTE